MKKFTTEKFVVFLFVLFLILPTFVFVLFHSAVFMPGNVLQEKVEPPVLSSETWNSYFSNLENYYNNNVPFRSQILKLNAAINYEVFHTIQSDKVLLGEDKWLFLKNNDDFKLAPAQIGGSSYSAAELEIFKNKLLAIKEIAEKNGASFTFTIAPNKERVYTELLPACYRKEASSYRADQLYQYIKENSDINISYPRHELLEVKTKYPYPFYNSDDSHWNTLGAFIAAQQMLEPIFSDRLYFDEVTINEVPPSQGDLTFMANVEDLGFEHPDYTITYDGIAEVIGDPFIFTPTVECVSNVQNGQKLLMLNDSFGQFLMPAVAPHFDECKFLLFYYVDWATLSQTVQNEQPTVVALEMAERNLDMLMQADIH